MMTPERHAKFEKVVRQRQTNMTVILENVHDPHNIGAVLRSCDAVGIKELYILHTRPDLVKEKVVVNKQTSTGARKWVDVFLFKDADACFAHIRKKYDKVLGTHMSEEAVGMHAIDMTQSIAFLFGNEKEGLTKEALSYCDGNFLIPMKGMVQSLNISVACAVTLFEAQRQREINGNYTDKPVGTEDQQKELLTTYLQRHETKWKGKEIVEL
ncbi:MAG: tRNA (guanosine-2'-O-)-methyltransferase [Polaribacter sp.]|jgi:tRNA (guanosine-2'-O-)-methyltransferase